MDWRIEKVISLLEASAQAEPSFKGIARQMNLSYSRLRYLFKAETGFSPSQYVRSIRMQQAKSYLENSFMSVKEIMLKVGFSDESHFVRDFKRIYGMTPHKYRTHYHTAHLGKQNGQQTSKSANE